MSKKIILYYSVILIVLIGKGAQTVFERSQVVNHGFTLAELRSEQRELQASKRQLSTQVAQLRSLNAVASSEIMGSFTRISKPVVITTGRPVASLVTAE